MSAEFQAAVDTALALRSASPLPSSPSDPSLTRTLSRPPRPSTSAPSAPPIAPSSSFPNNVSAANFASPAFPIAANAPPPARPASSAPEAPPAAVANFRNSQKSERARSASNPTPISDTKDNVKDNGKEAGKDHVKEGSHGKEKEKEGSSSKPRLRSASTDIPLLHSDDEEITEKTPKGPDTPKSPKTADPAKVPMSPVIAAQNSPSPRETLDSPLPRVANRLSGLADSSRGRFIGTATGTNGHSYGAMMSIDNVDFTSGHLAIEIKKLARISNSKKSNCYFQMNMSCGSLTWKQLRTDSQFLTLHEKVVLKQSSALGKADLICPLKGAKAKEYFKGSAPKTSSAGLKSRKKSSDDEDKEEDTYGAEELVAEMQAYVTHLASFTELLQNQKFHDFLDPSDEPSSWLMAKVAHKTGHLSLKDHPECFCAIYGGSLYVFRDMASEVPLQVVDLLCAKIDLLPQAQCSDGFFGFFVKVDDNEKEKFIFETRQKEEAETWVVNCRYGKSLNLKPLTQGQSSSKITGPSVASPTSPRDSNRTEAPQYEADNDKNTAKSSKGEFMGGTLDKILDKVIEGSLDQTAFLKCFPKVIDPLALLRKLHARFVHPRDDKFREQVVDFVTNWHQAFPIDFQKDEMPNALIEFMALKATHKLPTELAAKIAAISHPHTHLPASGSNPVEMERPTSLIPLCFGEGKFDFYDLNPMEIARQSTIVALNIYRRITMRELLSWNSKEEESKCPNALALVNHFNYLTSFFCTHIMSGANAKQRGYFLRHCIDVLKAGVEIRNYHLVYGVIAAVESAHVSRLKKTWAFLDPAREQLLNTYRAQFSPDGNYKNYRELVSKGPQPVLPSIAILAKDIFFIDEGNKTRLEGTNLVNWFKFPILANSISQVANAQSVRYPYTTVTEIRAFLADYKVFPNNELWTLSLTIEPREKKTDLVQRDNSDITFNGSDEGAVAVAKASESVVLKFPGAGTDEVEAEMLSFLGAKSTHEL